MLIEEAKWFADRISLMDPSGIFPMLNVGSSTEDFRRTEQPWIDEYIFDPLKKAGRHVEHLDSKEGRGVDIVGDFLQLGMRERLSDMGFRSVFCSNFLEHVTDIEEVARMLISIVPLRGYIFVSCPYRFPWHPDPLDNGFRPTVHELTALFPGTNIVSGGIVTDHTYLHYITRSPGIFAKTAMRYLMPFYRTRGWLYCVAQIPWLFRKYQVTTLVLKKN